jgi:hypothetical protein
MKFTLKGFFSVLMLIASLGTVVSIKADSCCGSSSGCSTTSDCACAEICDSKCTPLTNGCNVYGKTFYMGRSQGSNLARQMIGVEEKIHRFGNECFYGVGTLAIEYQRTMSNNSGNRDSRNLGAWFSSTGNTTMSYGVGAVGDGVGTNFNADLNALNWGYNGTGTIQFCPRKDDIIFDLNLYLGLDELFCGLWARFDIPIVRTKFNIGVIDKPATGGESAALIADLYGTTTAIDPVYNTFKAALLGDKEVGLLPKLNNAKICGAKDDTSVANIRLTLGYDWMRRECWHFATGLLFVLPVGTKPCGEFLFEPMVGNANRFEVGGTVNFAYELWENCDASHTVTMFVDGYVNTVVARRNRRILGLVPTGTAAGSQPAAWSQYLLLKKYNSSNQTTGLERAANITTGDIKVGASVEGAAAVLFQWNCNCLMAGVGYEAWGRTCEKAKARCFEIAANTYQLQGVSVYTGADAAGAADAANNQNAPTSTIKTPGALADSGTYLSSDDLDYCPALHTNANSNKVFGFVGYNWNECDWQPFILVGAEAEFGSNNRAFSQWGVIGKGGISF